MFEGLIAQLTPHARRLGTEADRRYIALMQALQRIEWSVERTREEGPDLDFYRRIQIPGVTAATGYTFDSVPPGEAWVITGISARTPWEIQLGGMLLWSSANSVTPEAPVLMPGDVAKLVPTGTTDIAVVIRRSSLRPDPQRDRSAGGKEGVINVTGTLHELNRDRPPVPILPAATR